MSIERTLVIIKPDAVDRRLTGKIIDRFLAKGLDVVAMKMKRLEADTVQKHYEVHKGRDFYGDLLEFMLSGPVILMVLEGKEAVQVVRVLLGPTEAAQASPGTIRGDWGLSTRYNLVHASDSLGSAQKEIDLFFQDSEICDVHEQDRRWILAKKNDEWI